MLSAVLNSARVGALGEVASYIKTCSVFTVVSSEVPGSVALVADFDDMSLGTLIVKAANASVVFCPSGTVLGSGESFSLLQAVIADATNIIKNKRIFFIVLVLAFLLEVLL